MQGRFSQNAVQRIIECARDNNDKWSEIINKSIIPFKPILQYYFIYLNMDKLHEHTIFFEEKHSTNIDEALHKEHDCPDSIAYLKKGDSNVYLDQFLAKDELLMPHISARIEESKKEDGSSQEADQSFKIEETIKFNPSSFHNFQKHLTVCLKHAISVTSEEKVNKDYQIVGAKLWKIFKNSPISTKKILHYLLGQKNEHPISEEGLKQCGLLRVYEAYTEQTLKEARSYLASETLRQIEQGKLEDYINSKKLKDKDRFKRYVEIFVDELREGYLRKRLPKEKVAYLLSL